MDHHEGLALRENLEDALEWPGRAAGDIEAQRAEQQLEAEYDWEGGDHHRADWRILPALGTLQPGNGTEYDAEQEQDAAADRLHGADAEIPHDVAVEEPLHEIAEMAEQECGHCRDDAQIAVLIPVTRRDRHILDDGAGELSRNSGRIRRNSEWNLGPFDFLGGDPAQRREPVGGSMTSNIDEALFSPTT